MSEVKGQILGVILTVVLFGTISAVLMTIFNTLSDKVVEETEEITGYTIPSSGNQLTGSLLTYQD